MGVNLMSDMDQILQAILELSKKMDRLELRMDKLEDRMGAFEERIETILDEKLERINEQIIVMASDNITTKADIRLLKKKMGMLDY